ncbi:MAG: 50S ribosomal protein L15 [Candidatus Levybacteria bacterium RIFCSPLOWO2_01_FULL_36_13]|nr:MAG: 50S ribosomal protein L15 [Candidatus Levybacteria bacterium RIFCSPHIGHO2_01_FULL_36_15b]OGH35031.1 MAG: 50S ribosomal protein L15 [Candidatus Levybacteria bacterium RIFCSPLOWO2_01_FULL_36_13]
MSLNNLSKIKKRGKKRLGQGHGSGRVKTAGRGTKGQNSRGKISLSFEGGALPLIKRLPFRRGKGRNRSFKKTPIIVNIKVLELLKDKSIIDLSALIKGRIVNEKDAKEYGVKILGDGKITKSFVIKLPISKQAAKKIEKAGGKIEL